MATTGQTITAPGSCIEVSSVASHSNVNSLLTFNVQMPSPGMQTNSCRKPRALTSCCTRPGTHTSSCTWSGAQNSSCIQPGTQNSSYIQIGTQTSSCERLGTQNSSCTEPGTHNGSWTRPGTQGATTFHANRQSKGENGLYFNNKSNCQLVWPSVRLSTRPKEQHLTWSTEQHSTWDMECCTVCPGLTIAHLICCTGSDFSRSITSWAITASDKSDTF
jgi:hypothetical protein